MLVQLDIFLAYKILELLRQNPNGLTQPALVYLLPEKYLDCLSYEDLQQYLTIMNSLDLIYQHILPGKFPRYFYSDVS
jgi:hypothetical protein